MIKDSTSSSSDEWRTKNLFDRQDGDEDIEEAAHFLVCGVALYLALVDSLEAGIGGVCASEVTEEVVLLAGICSGYGAFSVTRLVDVSTPLCPHYITLGTSVTRGGTGVSTISSPTKLAVG